MRILASFIAALFTLSAHAEMGFFDEAGAPPAIQAAAASVVQVLMPEGPIVKRYTQSDYQSPEFEAGLAEANGYYKFQMNFCKTHSLDICLIYGGYALSSGFVVGDRHHVATNRHVLWANIRDLINEYVKQGLSYHEAFTKAYARPFLLKVARNLKRIETGGREVVAVNWYKDESLYSLAMIDSAEFPKFLGSEVLVVKTELDLGVPPVKFAARQPLPGEPVYVLGFPYITTDRMPNFGKGDANGIRQISISKGLVIPLLEGFGRLSVMNGKIRSVYEKVQTNSALLKEWERNVLLTDADSDTGSSGGPVVNASGEVVGIQVARLVEYRGADPGLSFTFVSPLVHDFVRSPSLKLIE